MRKPLYLLTAAVLALSTLGACGTKSDADSSSAKSSSKETDAASSAEKTSSEELEDLVVGATPSPHAEILEAVKDTLKEKGYNLVIKEYTDYVQPDMALDSGDIDATYHQHQPFLDQFNEEHKTDLVSAASIHYEPFGIYAGKTKSLDDVKEGAQIAVPNDVSNEARALLLLQDNGLLTLKDGADLNATTKDIEKNDKNIKFVEVDAAQLPRSLADVDLAVINGNYAIDAGLKISDALATEDASSVAATTYSNIVAVRKDDKDNEKTKALVEALTSDTAKKFMEDKYAGAVVPSF
ncbi:MetQ/NlpA family ABC transporter substrate-binding protein [Blautia liquoris]|uniref:Lipoprotein n=1 Tax=Blautia liquoris TaxID=2779518 RepID=A0A7M2RGU4_9FIRM|nr:MetQ/NlpA family ABC transporter substrate-binding protein [Blautia liquoris]QOV19358.1 MetQ/NlpA family ABC transporter substrate-binding protein [Blautia liquoris]